MVSIVSLWLPILVSAALVFIASSIIHMTLKYHKNDFKQVPKETEVMDALRPFAIPPGEYILPYSGGGEAMKSPEFQEKVSKGPVALMSVMPNRMFNMGKSLTLWFIYCVVVSVISAYVTGRALGPGEDYLAVFRFAGVTAFACYAMAMWQATIWFNRPVATTLRANIDGLIYAFCTAGVFGWLWPS